MGQMDVFHPAADFVLNMRIQHELYNILFGIIMKCYFFIFLLGCILLFLYIIVDKWKASRCWMLSTLHHYCLRRCLVKRGMPLK